HERARGGECPGAPEDGGAHGAVELGRTDGADHRQQERDERRLCDALRRHGGRLFGAEGRLQDDGVRAVALAQFEQAGNGARPGRSGHARAGDHQAADGGASSGAEGRGQPAALFGARPNPRRAGRKGNVRRRSRQRDRRADRARRRHRIEAPQGRVQAPPGASGGEDRHAQLRPRPALPDQQFLPHRAEGESAAMSVVTRFAPSPTGRLHVGNIRTALHNFLFARKNRGTFILRIDDTDRERSTDEFDLAIRDDLEWLGLAPDKLVRQSERFDIYEREFEKLKSAGRVYACYETPEELELRRKVLLGRGLPPVYERKPADAPAPKGRAPHWRFRLDHDSPIAWNDLIRSEQKFDPGLLSDPVVRREDGSWLYLLPSVIDDVDLGITHVVRGEDHVSNSAVQIQMFEALRSRPPHFAHEALLVAAEGKLSKRLGSYGAEHLREEGVEPMAMLSVLARIGTSQPV